MKGSVAATRNPVPYFFPIVFLINLFIVFELTELLKTGTIYLGKNDRCRKNRAAYPNYYMPDGSLVVDEGKNREHDIQGHAVAI